MWSSQLFKHNETAIELQIGPSSTNKQIWDTMVTTMFCHFFGPWRWAPYMGVGGGGISLKKIPECKVLLPSHTSKLNQQKQWYVVSKSASNIYTRLVNMNTSP